jgi:Asp-tRNA(Asn)/Glu-tRNA(Gln) amidotransferase A subunit family amidase
MTQAGQELISTLKHLAADARKQPVAAITAAWDRIEERDAVVHAWTYVEDCSVLQAIAARTSPDAPLAGVPFAVKDVIDVAGMPTRCGSEVEPEAPRAFDASCVSLLRRAGAIPIGKAVTAEYAYREPGPTQNPRAPGHTPGGSSSGSAAAVADGMVPFALGTQTGGSLIRPAAYCGVVGFKPSFGAIFRDGLRLTCESLDVIGWHTRSVADCELLADILLPYAAPSEGLNARPRKIAVVAGGASQGLEPAGQRALQRARDIFQNLGIQCDEVPFAQNAEIVGIHGTIMHYEFARSLYPVVCRDAQGVSASIRETVQKGFEIAAQEYLEKRHAQLRWRAAWDAMFGDADLILTPSAPGVAPQGLANTGTSTFNRVWSALGWPCLHLPMGVCEAGLPIGVQLVGRFEHDRQLLAWAQTLHGDLLA